MPDGFELGWSPDNGGTLRINSDSDVRMLWFPEANASLVRPTAETRQRLVELADSRTTEINPPKGQRTLVAICSSEGRHYFVTVSKVNETWANPGWRQARGVDDGPSGRVVDQAGRGVRGATIVFSRWDHVEQKDQRRTVISEGSGGFFLPRIEPGEWVHASISAPGFQKLESLRIERRADMTYIPADLTFELRRLDISKAHAGSIPANEKVRDQVAEGLQVSIAFAKTTFALDEPIPVTWRIKNMSREDKTIVWHELHYSPVVIEIGKKGEKKYIRGDYRRVFTGAIPGPPTKILLRPGDVKEATFDLRYCGLRQPSGVYEVTGLYSPKDNRMLTDMFLQKSEFKDAIDTRIDSATTEVTLTENLVWLKKELSDGTFHSRLSAAR